MKDERPKLDGPPPLATGPRGEPEWLAQYLDRKAAQFMIMVGADTYTEWVGPGGNLDAAVKELVRTVVGEMAVHLAAPHAGPGEDPVREAREKWAAGS